MDANLARMADDLEIRRVLARYCRGFDRMDAGLVESVFWPEATVTCPPPFDGTAKDWIAYVLNRLGGDRLSYHGLQQSLIEIDGNVAEAETYFIARHAYDEDGGLTIMAVLGRYADLFEKRDGVWKIARRAIIMDARHFDRQPAPSADAPVARRADDLSFVLGRLSSEALSHS